MPDPARITRRRFIAAGGSALLLEPRRLSLSGEDWMVASFEPGSGVPARAFAEGFPPARAVPAIVPGDVHWDLERAGRIPNLYYGLNSRQANWVAGREWWYRKRFDAPQAWNGKIVRLRFEGVDYLCDVWVNGLYVGRHEGQFTPFEFDVSGSIVPGAANTLAVLIHPAPESVRRVIAEWSDPGRFTSMSGEWPLMQAMRATYPCWKSMTNAGWDWGAKLITMGIWKDVRLIASEGVALSDLIVFADTRSVLARVRVLGDTPFELIAEGAGIQASRRVSKPGEHELAFAAPDARLWWPSGYGPQHLYELTVKAVRAGREVDRIGTRFGMRRIRMLENPPSPEETGYVDYAADKPLQHPLFTGSRRYQIEINGRRVFAKGANWIPCDLLFGRPRRRDYEHLLRLFARANCNLLRMWGGGIIEKPEFYEVCDELGIMLFQEFPNAGPRLPETEEALAVTGREASEVLRGLVNHPSIVRWGGGNEWYRTAANSRHMAQLRKIAAGIDPTRPYHDPDPETLAQRHGPHSFEYPGSYRVYNTGKPMSAGPDIPLEWTEYGAAGASSVNTLRRIMPEGSLWPIRSDDPHWAWHKGFRAYGAANWLGSKQHTALFGELPDLETTVKVSQFVQAEALRYANQAMRRRRPHLSACAFWTYNEPWPNAAHDCVVEHYGAPKMAYYYVMQSYAPVDVSLVYDDLAMHSHMPVWVSSDLARKFDNRWRGRIFDTRGALLAERTGAVFVPADTSARVGELVWTPPPDEGQAVLVLLELADKGYVVARNLYTFGNLRALLAAPETTLDVQPSREGVRIANTGATPALFVKLETVETRAYFDENYLFLLPGERRSVRVTPAHAPVTAQAWNSKPVRT